MAVIYQSTEDDADDTVVPRFIASGGNWDNLIFIKESEKHLTFGDDRLQQPIERYNVKLLILDPLSSYIGEDCSMNDASKTRTELNHCNPCPTGSAGSFSMTSGMTVRTGKSRRNWRSRCARCITFGSVRLRKSVHIMSYTGKDETPELTYALIQGAVHGDKAALEMILRHFDAYINAVSTVKKMLPSGEVIEEVDEDIKSQIQAHLLEVIQEKWRELI